MTVTSVDYRIGGWRLAGWGSLLALLALPALAMQLTDEVRWTAGDFLFAAILLGALGAGVEVAVSAGRDRAHKAGLACAALAGFLTLWINAAVGIIGESPINLAYFAIVIGAGAAGVLLRLRAGSVASVLVWVVVLELATGIAADIAGQGDWSPVLFTAAFWLPAILLLRRSAAAAAAAAAR